MPYSAQQMFDLVNDIDAYPLYMDGCVGAQVLRRDDALIEARLDLSRGGIRQSFTTRNRLVAPSSIVMELVEGPFTEFEGNWAFKALQEDACKVSLDLRFSVSNKVVGMAARKLFDSVTGNLVDALCQRAREIYLRS
jgi:ribosome-associated toxin RatA of RatAB toxin-antitoxin module